MNVARARSTLELSWKVELESLFVRCCDDGSTAASEDVEFGDGSECFSELGKDVHRGDVE